MIFVSEKAFYFVTHPKMHLVTRLIVHTDQAGYYFQLGAKTLLSPITSYLFVSL